MKLFLKNIMRRAGGNFRGAVSWYMNRQYLILKELFQQCGGQFIGFDNFRPIRNHHAGARNFFQRVKRELNRRIAQYSDY